VSRPESKEDRKIQQTEENEWEKMEKKGEEKEKQKKMRRGGCGCDARWLNWWLMKVGGRKS
jgi:hypothetical protein